MACKLKDRASNVCRFKDALTPVLEEIADADGLALGSPIYFGEVTGQMQRIVAYNTCHVKDYGRYELAGFSEEGKHRWRDTHWEEDLHKAYQAGRVIAGCTQKADDGQRPDDGQ